MCEPTAIMLGMAVASAGLQYQQASMQASAIEQQGKNNARISEFNARQQEVAATEATRRGAQNAGMIRENTRRVNATARARMASAGIDADAGTPATLLDQNIQTGETNAMVALRDAELEAMGFKNAAIGQRFQGSVGSQNARYSARTKRASGLLDATGTLVTGVGNYGISKGWFE